MSFFSKLLGSAASDAFNVFGGNINTVTTSAGITAANLPIPSHTHNIQISNAINGGMHQSIPPYREGFYGAVIDMIAKQAARQGARCYFVQSEDFESDSIVLDFEVRRGSGAAHLDLGIILQMALEERLEDLDQYLDVTIAMLPPEAPQAYEQQAYASSYTYGSGWVDPNAIYGTTSTY